MKVKKAQQLKHLNVVMINYHNPKMGETIRGGGFVVGSDYNKAEVKTDLDGKEYIFVQVRHMGKPMVFSSLHLS